MSPETLLAVEHLTRAGIECRGGGFARVWQKSHPHTRRKDLTAFEQSNNLVQLAEVSAEVLAPDLLPTVSNKSPRGRGRPKKTDSEKKIAERIGVPRQTINDAKQHLAALKRYPELEIILPASRAQHSAIVRRVNGSISPTHAGVEGTQSNVDNINLAPRISPTHAS